MKTRLAAEIGETAARAAYRALAETVWAGLAHPSFERHLWVEPAAALERARRWLPGAARAAGQEPGDLGARLHAAMAAAFDGGAPWAAAVGSDAPEVDAERVLGAAAALDRADVALIPALDGGYALIALRAPEPRLFTGVPWGSDQVLAVTRARAAALGLRVAALEPASDVDTAADLRRAAARFPRVWPSMLPAPPP